MSALASLTPLEDLRSVSAEIFERWDKDMRSGKLLTALEGRVLGYDRRVNRIRHALAIFADSQRDPWSTMQSAPKDRWIIVYAPGGDLGLDDIVGPCLWHEDAGFCVDELRQPAMWREMPLGPSAYDDSISSAARDVFAERQRQISAESRTTEHDDAHDNGELAMAAAAYAWSSAMHGDATPFMVGWNQLWPWEYEEFKPKTPRENLVRAGALIVAEIERIDRQESLPW